MRDVGECRQKKRIRQVVRRREDDALQIHRARDQDETGESDSRALQLVGERGATRRAVAFAGQVDCRAPALVTRQPDPHYVGQRGDVTIDRQQLLARVEAGGGGPSGMRWIDEDEVEMFEPAVRIVGHRIGRRRHRRVVGGQDALRPQRAKVKPDRRRTRAAVKGEAHRARARVGALQHIAGREHGSLGFAERSLKPASDDRQKRRANDVVERLRAQGNGAAALASRLRDELVDSLAHLLVGFLGVAAGLRRVGHEVSCE